jgi:hypothetical protein
MFHRALRVGGLIAALAGSALTGNNEAWAVPYVSQPTGGRISLGEDLVRWRPFVGNCQTQNSSYPRLYNFDEPDLTKDIAVGIFASKKVKGRFEHIIKKSRGGEVIFRHGADVESGNILFFKLYRGQKFSPNETYQVDWFWDGSPVGTYYFGKRE